MQYRNGDRRKQPTVGSIIGIILALAFFSPEWLGVLIVIGMAVLPIYIFYRIAKRNGGTKKERKESFDECPKPICFHRDKGEHHVRKGKEIDPWDRPDIDISKYQRK